MTSFYLEPISLQLKFAWKYCLFLCCVFIVLKKAFKTVDHAILLDKLNHYGFCGIINKWFSSCLLHRTQTPQAGPHISERTLTTCGVPQGSAIGPSLFKLYGTISMTFTPVPKNHSIPIFLLMTLISYMRTKTLSH